MSQLYGTMIHDVKLLGCSLSLQQGQRVSLNEATNVPLIIKGSVQFFVQPADGQWADGLEHDEEDSILIDVGEVTDLGEGKGENA